MRRSQKQKENITDEVKSPVFTLYFPFLSSYREASHEITLYSAHGLIFLPHIFVYKQYIILVIVVSLN